MKISPKYSSTHFNRLRLSENSRKPKWQKAVKIFDDRYTSRYIKPILALSKNNDLSVWEYSGFAIMALNCLLIETLNQFYYGANDTDRIKTDITIPHITSIEGAFVDFLARSNHFSTSFNTRKARLFYKQIRCGLLHQAETKKSSVIHIRLDQPELVTIKNYGRPNEGISLRRDLFTNQLIKEYKDYKKKLLSVPVDIRLRQAFIRKMKNICDTSI